MDEIQELQKRLVTNRNRLTALLNQQSIHGLGYTPPGILADIVEARADIQRIKAYLRGRGISVEDEADDAILPIGSPLRATHNRFFRDRSRIFVIIPIAGILLCLSISLIGVVAKGLLPSSLSVPTTQTPQSASLRPSGIPTYGNAGTTTSPQSAPKPPIASNLPGSPLPLNVAVTSVFDMLTKPQDVYSLNLMAGQNYNVHVESENAFDVAYINPVSARDPFPFEFKFHPSIGLCYSFTILKCDSDFRVAVDGTYYLRIRALARGQSYAYTMTVSDSINP